MTWEFHTAMVTSDACHVLLTHVDNSNQDLKVLALILTKCVFPKAPQSRLGVVCEFITRQARRP